MAPEPGRPVDGSRDGARRGWWLRAGLRTRLAVCTTVLTVASVSISFLAFGLQTRKHTRRQVADSVVRQQALVREVESRRLNQLLRASTLLTGSPTLRAAMETYRGEADGDEDTRADLLYTIQVEADKVAAILGRDLLVITDDTGTVLAEVGSADGSIVPGTSLHARPVVEHALSQTGPVSPANLAVLRVGPTSYRVGTVPIVLQGFVIGSLILGDALDGDYFDSLARTFEGEILVRDPQQVLVGNLPENRPQTALLRALDRGRAEGSDTTLRLRWQDEEYVSAALPLGIDDVGRPVELVLLRSMTRELARSTRGLSVAALGIGALAVVLAGLVSWLASRSVLARLTRFVSFMESAAGAEDHDRRYEDPDADPDVLTLIETYNRLMSSLARHEQDLRRRAQEDLERMERLKESEKLAALGRMLSGAAHEINNPLTGVIGNVEMLLSSRDLAPQDAERLETVRRNGRRIVALVRNLLKIAHRSGPELSPVDVNRVVGEVAALRRHDFLAAGIALELALHDDPLWVHGNELELEQVVLNLLNNALDALVEAVVDRPIVRIRTALENGRVVVTTTDTGPGLEDPSRVFEHFYTTKPVGKGTGLGLSICRAIVERHQGRMRAENSDGAGACFTIDLPLAEPASTELSGVPPVEPPADEPAASTADRSLRASVLVVDDEPSVLELQLAILDSLGASVVGVDSGDEAIRRLQEQDFDLVVSDMRMPGGVNGKDLFRWIQGHRPQTAPRFVFVTGDLVDEAEFLESSGSPYVIKPFTFEEYIGTLQETLHAS